MQDFKPKEVIESEVRLSDYIRIIFQLKWVVLLVFLGVVISTFIRFSWSSARGATYPGNDAREI